MSRALSRTAVLSVAWAWLSSASAGLAGQSQATSPALAQQPAASAEVLVYHAGSLNAMFDSLGDVFGKATGIRVTHRGMGSVDAARRTTVGKEPCDIYAGADYVIIDAWMKPTYADFNIAFGQSAMVLTYTTTSKNAASIADPAGPAFAPPASVPNAAAKWYVALTQPGVRIGGSDPSLDPGGYRPLMVLQLAQSFYGVPTLYEDLHRNYAINGPNDRLGSTVDYQVSYEHSAKAAAARDPNFRYVKLPSEIDLSSPDQAARYAQAVVPISGLTPADPTFPMRGTRALFGLTLLKNAPNKEAAIRFLQFMLSTRPGEGVAIQTVSGPEPMAPDGPATVSKDDFPKLPGALAPLVKIRP
jgi:molybdate/tungstate transport system substrate-binding protein